MQKFTLLFNSLQKFFSSLRRIYTPILYYFFQKKQSFYTHKVASKFLKLLKTSKLTIGRFSE